MEHEKKVADAVSIVKNIHRFLNKEIMKVYDLPNLSVVGKSILANSIKSQGILFIESLTEVAVLSAHVSEKGETAPIEAKDLSKKDIDNVGKEWDNIFKDPSKGPYEEWSYGDFVDS